jgi:carbon monoxide dehydrogenase subunit G
MELYPAMKFELSETMNASPEDVFEVMTSLETWQEWMPNLVRVEKLTEGDFGVGTEWKEVREMYGKEAAEYFEVTGYEPNERIDLYVDGSKGATGRGEFFFVQSVRPHGDQTVITVAGEARGMGLIGKLFGWLFKRMFVKAMRKDFEAMRDYVEQR